MSALSREKGRGMGGLKEEAGGTGWGVGLGVSLEKELGVLEEGARVLVEGA